MKLKVRSQGISHLNVVVTFLRGIYIYIYIYKICNLYEIDVEELQLSIVVQLTSRKLSAFLNKVIDGRQTLAF